MSDRPRGRAPDRPRSRSRSGDRSNSTRSNSRTRYSGTAGGRDERRGDFRGSDRGSERGGHDRGYDRGRDEPRGSDQRQPYDPSRSRDPRQEQPYGQREDPGRPPYRPQGERGGYDRGGDRGGYGGDRGGGRGGYGGDRGGYGGDRGGYGGDRGGYGGDRGGDRGGYGGDRGGYGGDRGGYGGDRGGYGGDRGGRGGRGGGRGGFGGDRGGFGGGQRGPQGPSRTEPENIELYTNYFELLSRPNWTLYQYHVDFEPMIESKRLRIGLLKKHDNLFSNNKAFDGMTLYSLTKLDNEVTELESIKEFDQQKVNIKIKLVNQVPPSSTESMRLLNIVFKRCLNKSKFIEFGRERAYFDFENMHELTKYHLKIAAGYKASMDVYSSRIFLCTELAHKLINFDSVWDVMEKLYREKNAEDYKYSCNNQLIGSTIMTSYNKKTYRIDDIEWTKSPGDSFAKKNGDMITFADYYYEHHKIKIRNLQQPLLVSLPKEKDKKRGQDTPILLVPELCLLTGTILLKQFEKDFTMKKDLDAITKLNPEVRIKRLRQFLDKITRQPEAKQDLENWQMEFNPDVVKVNATALVPITVQFQNTATTNTERGWNNAMRDGIHLSAIPLRNWVLFYLPRDEQKANLLMTELMSVSDPMGFRIERGQMCKLPDSGRGSSSVLFSSSIKEIVTSANPQMVVCIVPNTNKDTYDAIKVTCCIDFGVPSQVVTTNILNFNNMNKTKSAVTKIAIQMNCKLGGEPWGVTIPLKNIMVVGMDFYKDSAKKNVSVAAFIASINGTQENKLNCTKYFSKCHLQPKGEEFVSGLQIFMLDALNKYYERNNAYPDRIFVYRDGVSDGQFPTVQQFEIPQIQNAFKAINENYKPRMTFFIVKKRGNSRFFLKGNRDEFTNPPIGTVIDNTVTKYPGEFYLIAQSTNQGTVSPTHFHVIEDTNELSPDKLQIITYRFTHMYYNWPGQIRSPACCHYASKLAHLVGESLHRPHAPALDDKLFYL